MEEEALTTGVDLGLWLNVGADRLEFKRKHRTYRPRSQHGGPG